MTAMNIRSNALLLGFVVFGSSCDSHSHSTARQKLSDEAGKPKFAYAEIYYRLIKDTNTTVEAVFASLRQGNSVTNIICPIHQNEYVFNQDGSKWRGRERFTDEIAVFCPQPHHDHYLAIRFDGSYRTPKEKPNVTGSNYP
jgi:hypothetical protein